jgi:two-component system OmpR family response regulator
MLLPVPFVHPITHPLRVLLADDNRDAVDSLAELLKVVGCEVRVCYDGESVLPLAERFDPDVCILDLWMPKATGWKVARQLREWADGRSLLLIALTGIGGQQAKDDSDDAGFDHHILKPADPHELFRDFAEFIKTMEPVVLQLA